MAKFTGNTIAPHDTVPVTGILLTNLGTPQAPTKKALRKYLEEFLNDKRVIETPRIIWWPILYGIILTLRPKRSAHAYAQIWTNEGSPLMVITSRLVEKIAKLLEKKIQYPIKVEVAMRYGEPSIKSALEKLRKANAQRILVFPLYPQYSATTTGSTFDEVARVFQSWRQVPEMRFVSHYHDDAGYISALTESIRTHWAEHGIPDKLLFSFHGLPKNYFDAGDPYFCECHKTARLVAEQLKLEDHQWKVSFQSRFGPMEWLQPYADDVLLEWARNNISNVHIICPGFSADCLETLEEIQIRYRSVYLNAGGKQFSYIPALNDDEGHIEALSSIILKNCEGWTDYGWLPHKVAEYKDKIK
ncbi:MAG: ferrochelatase [Gammaproteobacteria bacterium]|jgi:ferrochelatase